MGNNECNQVLLNKYVKVKTSKRLLKKQLINEGTIPFYRQTDVISLHENGMPKEKDISYVPEELFNEIIKKYNYAKRGDILLTTIGSLGVPYMIRNDDKFYIKDCAVVYFTDYSEDIDNEFLYHWLNSKEFKGQINSIEKGSVMKHLYLSDLNKLKITLPTLNEQRNIRNILSTIDAKIGINNQINKHLEATAKALYHEWFVNFNFPNEDGLPYKDNGGEFVESEVGEIPVGWEAVNLPSIAELQNGFAFYKAGYSESGKKVVDLVNINSSGRFIESERDKFVSLETYRNPKYEKYHLNKNDLVMIMTDRTQEMNILGKVGKIPESDKYVLNQRIFRIRPKLDVFINYLYNFFNSKIILETFKSVSLGSVQKYINTSHIKDISVIIPNEIIINKYAKVADPLYDKIEDITKENQTLVKMKTLSLNKLMSGQIDTNELDLDWDKLSKTLEEVEL